MVCDLSGLLMGNEQLLAAVGKVWDGDQSEHAKAAAQTAAQVEKCLEPGPHAAARVKSARAWTRQVWVEVVQRQGFVLDLVMDLAWGSRTGRRSW